MSETNTQKSGNQHRSAPADAATPFFTAQTFWKNEMHRFFEESNAAMERGYGELERMAQESARMNAAGVKTMHDAGRQWMAAARAFLG